MTTKYWGCGQIAHNLSYYVKRLLQRRKRLACCLIDLGATRPSIGQALAGDTLQRFLRAGLIVNAERDTVRASSPDERSEIRDKRPSPQTAPGFHFVQSGLRLQPRQQTQIRRGQKSADRAQLATNRIAVSQRSSSAAAMLPKNSVSPGRRVTPSTTRS
jgi:hypothetical protein